MLLSLFLASCVLDKSATSAAEHETLITMTTQNGLQVIFDRDRGEPVSLKLDTNHNGKWDDEQKLFYSFSYDQNLLDTSLPEQSPRLVASEKTDGGLWFGAVEDVDSGLPATIVWYVPANKNLVFARYKAKAQKDCGVSAVFLNTNFGHDIFIGEKYWLPRGVSRPQSDYEDIDYGFWDVRDHVKNGINGCIFSADKIGIAYKVLDFKGGDTLYCRFTKGKDIAFRNVGGRSGWLRPEFDLGSEMVRKGTELVYEFVYYIEPWQGAQKTAEFFRSADFTSVLSSARKELSGAELAMADLQKKWKSSMTAWNYHRDISRLKVNIARCQVDLHLASETLLDRRIAAELSGETKDWSNCQTLLSEARNSLNDLTGYVQKLNSAKSRIGSRFSRKGDITQAMTPLQNAYENCRKAKDDCRLRIEALNTAIMLSDTDNTILSSDESAADMRASFMDEPLFSACWIAPGSNCLNTVDDYTTDLKKLKLMGLNAINTSEHYLPFERIIRLNRHPDSRRITLHALLDPIREAGLKALVGITTVFHSKTNSVIPPEMISTRLVLNKDRLDYENPAFRKFKKQNLGDFASFLRSEFNDVVIGFDYDNEYGWNQNFSPHAKPRFIEYLRQRHETITALNSAWRTDFASWKELEEKLILERGAQLLAESSRDWWSYANQAFTRRFWGSTYKGLKIGWPESVCVARSPRAFVLSSNRKAPVGEKMTDIVDGHWQKTTEGTPAPILSALADGKPIIHTEFWWVHAPRQSIRKAYGNTIAEEYHNITKRLGFETLCALDGRRQMWEYFFEGCKGFVFFPDPSVKGNLLNYDGMLKDAAAAMAPTIRKVTVLSKVIGRTEPDAKIAIFLRDLANGPISTRAEFSRSAIMLLQTLNIPFVVLPESDVQQGKLNGFTHLWLADGERLECPTVKSIEQWIQNGGTLIASGPAGVKDDNNHEADMFSHISGVKFAAAPGGESIVLKGKNIIADLSAPASASGFQQHTEGIPVYLKNRYSCGARTYSIAAVNNDVNVLGNFETGKPAVTRRKYGKGSVICMAAPIDEFLFTAVNLHDRRGENYIQSLLACLDEILNLADVKRPVMLNRQGDCSFKRDNVRAFLRRPKNGNDKRYLFLLNTGYAFAGKYGSIHYGLSPYVHEEKTGVTEVRITGRAARIHEMLRKADVKYRYDDNETVLNLKLYPGRCYAFEIEY
jgi:hypothetical protein